MRFLF